MLLRLAVLVVACAPLALPQTGSLPQREALYYNIEWRLITAGKAQLEWSSSPQGRQVKLHVESVGLVSKLFKVEDDYTAALNQSLCALSSQLTSHEGSRLRDTRIAFDYPARKASYLERDRAKNTTLAAMETEIPSCVHDLVGGLYYLRTLNLEPNQSAQIPVSDGKKAVTVRVEARQREDVKTPSGSYKTIPYEIFIFDNVLFRRSAHLHVWLADDRARTPVQIRVRMAFTVGSITLQLEKRE